MKGFLFIAGLFSLIFLTGCAHSPNVSDCIPEGTHIYGFWAGTWHGMIMWFSLVGSIFDDTIKVYAINNNGFWYNFGFVGGLFLPIKALNEFLKTL